MTDLTAITVPFGMLDEVHGPGTREAMRAHGGPYEFFNGSMFALSLSTTLENIDPGLTYRVKPQPPKPREAWTLQSGRFMYDTRDEAEKIRRDLQGENPGLDFGEVMRWREVIE